eukprot:COSAG04_NODE_1180_length_7903_cov_22.082394_8_plen_174_part_00
MHGMAVVVLGLSELITRASCELSLPCDAHASSLASQQCHHRPAHIGLRHRRTVRSPLQERTSGLVLPGSAGTPTAGDGSALAPAGPGAAGPGLWAGDCEIELAVGDMPTNIYPVAGVTCATSYPPHVLIPVLDSYTRVLRQVHLGNLCRGRWGRRGTAYCSIRRPLVHEANAA